MVSGYTIHYCWSIRKSLHVLTEKVAKESSHYIFNWLWQFLSFNILKYWRRIWEGNAAFRHFHMDKELLALRNNFRATKKFLNQNSKFILFTCKWDAIKQRKKRQNLKNIQLLCISSSKNIGTHYSYFDKCFHC